MQAEWLSEKDIRENAQRNRDMVESYNEELPHSALDGVRPNCVNYPFVGVDFDEPNNQK